MVVKKYGQFVDCEAKTSEVSLAQHIRYSDQKTESLHIYLAMHTLPMCSLLDYLTSNISTTIMAIDYLNYIQLP